jgi:uncharacterized protein
MKRNAVNDAARRNHHVIIGPGLHCAFQWSEATRVGEQPVSSAGRVPYMEWYAAWFRHWLTDASSPLPALPPYLLYVMAEDRWIESPSWPVAGVEEQGWYLHADRVLAPTRSRFSGSDEYVSDPAKPVPTRGGPICCTGNPSDRPGPADQRDIAKRADVLTFTSAPLEQGLRVVGDLKARLYVSSSARDTDFIAKLVDIWPDGRALSVQEGALRMRYRNGFESPTLLEPGRVYEIVVDMRAIAHRFAPGHRIALQIASTNFPRLERNLQTGGRNYDETVGVTATNVVLHGPEHPSALMLPILPDRTVVEFAH